MHTRVARLSSHLRPAPPLRKVLVANRGEIALRVLRAAKDLEIETVAIHAPADAAARHVRSASEAVAVPSYLDIAAIVRAAVRSGCDALHPGYGFLSESAALARQCEEAGLAFVGPTPATLDLLGDKLAARQLAHELGIPTAAGSTAACASASDVATAMAAASMAFPVMLKAVGGGGGRGMRPVRAAAELEGAFAACVREAEATGSAGGVFVEELIEGARHVEVQVLGDAHGELVHLFDRDCSVRALHTPVQRPSAAYTPPAWPSSGATAAAEAD
jgi:acetyl/propionyl-CoA carboxylase alpha subunit